MADTLLTKIRHLLLEHGISFEERIHAPTFTSEESAAARGEALDVGAKALLLKTDNIFRLFVLPANRKLNSAAIKLGIVSKLIYSQLHRFSMLWE